MSCIPNILAERYAGDAMTAIWSPAGKVLLEREFWIAILKAQRELGLDIPGEAIEAYENVRERVDLESIDRRERKTRHDVKARIEEFCELAGHQHIHKGLTSRDLTENVEQLQVRRSLELTAHRTAALLAAIARRAVEFRDQPLTMRTHNVPAQPGTMGKRLANYGEELLYAARRVDDLLLRLPVRGLKGAVGSQLDQMTLFGGDKALVEQLDARIVAHLGFPEALGCVGQVYPRSMDLDVVAALVQLGCGPVNLTRSIRLMAGHETAGEGFAEGQVGSSAMPHKMNSRSCERVNGFQQILRGHLTMAAGIAGDQWHEGDVSCSVARRVIMPDAFFTIDGLLQTAMTILEQMEIYPSMLEYESERVQPFLASTTLLMEAVNAGAGREEAHEAIKEHAVAAVRALRAGERRENDLAERLAADRRIPLTREQVDRIIGRARRLTGRCGEQVDGFAQRTHLWVERFPGAADYRPPAIL